MPQPQVIVRVKFKSDLNLEDVTRIAEERAPEFSALAGLQQKYYIHDVQTGEYGGLYVWSSEEAFAEYRESELRASIAEAYQAQGEPDIEVYRILMVLREDIP